MNSSDEHFSLDLISLGLPPCQETREQVKRQ